MNSSREPMGLGGVQLWVLLMSVKAGLLQERFKAFVMFRDGHSSFEGGTLLAVGGVFSELNAFF